MEIWEESWGKGDWKMTRGKRSIWIKINFGRLSGNWNLFYIQLCFFFSHWPPSFRTYYEKIGHHLQCIEKGKINITEQLDKIAAHQSEIVRIRNEKRYCELCSFTGYTNNAWQKHLDGQKHKKKEQRQQQRRFCEFCYVTAFSDSEFEKHLRGRKHLKNQR